MSLTHVLSQGPWWGFRREPTRRGNETGGEDGDGEGRFGDSVQPEERRGVVRFLWGRSPRNVSVIGRPSLRRRSVGVSFEGMEALRMGTGNGRNDFDLGEVGISERLKKWNRVKRSIVNSGRLDHMKIKRVILRSRCP